MLFRFIKSQQLLSRHDELKERARQLLEATKREAKEKDKKCENDIMNGLNDIGSPKKVLFCGIFYYIFFYF